MESAEYKYKVSVISAVYNCEEYLEEAIDSIIDQTLDFENIQIVLVDDGSSDGSGKICDRYKEEYPDNTIYNVDTRCVSGGLGLLVMNVCRLYEAGETKESVLEWIEENKLRIAHRFTVDDLQWLRRGGRVSNASQSSCQ